MDAHAPLSRRALLGAAAGTAAGAAAGLTLGRLPAWARPLTAAANATAGLRRPDSLPFPGLPAGTPTMPRIEHVVVLMMENHSFDNLLGMVPHEVAGRSQVDGLTLSAGGRTRNFNRDRDGHRVYARRAESPCQASGHPTQSWNASHASYNHGRNDGFVRAGGDVAMWYWDRSDLPFTYSLVEHFPIGQRYFCSTLGQTYPNRRFLFCGTASGITSTDNLTFSVPAANGTIFERLTQHGIEWVNYYEDLPSLLIVPGHGHGVPVGALRRIDQFYLDAQAGRLAPFTFIDPNYATTSQENPQDIQLGERFIAKVVSALMRAPTWRHTALFITYDEHGGYYDHVPPPRAIAPDAIAPLPDPHQTAPLVAAGYDRYGFRVPLIVVSPWARPGYVSSVTQDHTSITAFIEHKWNLPAMSFRDANAQPLTDYFDFSRAAFATPPRLHSAPGLQPGLDACHRAGYPDPPLSEPGTISD